MTKQEETAKALLTAKGYSVRKKRVILTTAQSAVLEVLAGAQRLSPLNISVKTQRQIREKTFRRLSEKGFIKAKGKVFDIQKSLYRLTSEGRKAIA